MIYFKAKSITITNYSDNSIQIMVADSTTNEIIDLRGYSVVFTAKADRKPTTTPIISIINPDNPDAINGNLEIKLSRALVSSLTAGTYIYEVNLINVAGEIISLYQSDLHIDQSMQLA